MEPHFLFLFEADLSRVGQGRVVEAVTSRGEPLEAFAQAVVELVTRLTSELTAAEARNERGATREAAVLTRYYLARRDARAKGLQRSVHATAVLQVRLALARTGTTRAGFRRELAASLKNHRSILAEAAADVGVLGEARLRRLRESTRRWQAPVVIRLRAAYRLQK